jgi:serine/threonine protein kinase
MSTTPRSDESIFAEALEKRTADQRAAFLDAVCGANAEQRARLERLLKSHDEAGSFLRQSLAARETVDQQPLTERPGTVIGPYKLMEQLGEGGMGLVFVAEQQEPVRRKVALKVIKPGMDTREVIARFEAERQALALMDHPNIARVLDAGATDSGRPYFVMELVKGVPITDYCDQQQLTPRERLELFIPVCQAVQHAHTKGVIHRDLKPSNILIAPHDGKPVVKVIDFGVAKAVGQPLTDKTIYTRVAQMIGTPLYMSPEQAELNALDVDTRSDVYALAVLLYELLTGTTPFDRQRFGEAAFDEIRRIIREEEPPRPSTRLSTLGATLPVVSARRKTEPGKLSALIKGDLDWIVMKGLDKDRTHRYETASGLARDIERYLHDEPVEAGPPSAAYRLRKFIRRNRGPVAVAAVVLVTVLAGTAGTTGGWMEALAQRDEALQARQDEAEQRGIAEVNVTQARENAKVARDNAAQAAASAALATKQEMLAMQLATLANEERKRAQDEKQLADLARKKAEDNERMAEWRLYASHLASAQQKWESDNVPMLYHYLDLARQDFRGWEHDYLYSLANQYQQILPVPLKNAQHLAFSADGKRLAVAMGGDSDYPVAPKGAKAPPRMVKVFDLASGQEVLAIKGLGGPVVFSPDGKLLASGDGDPTVWDAASGINLWTLPGHKGSVESLAFSPDSKYLATGSWVETKLWDMVNRKEVRSFPRRKTPNKYVCVAFNHDGSRLAATASNSVNVWEVASGKEILTLDEQAPIIRVVFSPDGKLLAGTAQGGPDLSGKGLGLVKVWDTADGRELFTFKGPVDRLAFSADGKRLASAANLSVPHLPFEFVYGDKRLAPRARAR